MRKTWFAILCLLVFPAALMAENQTVDELRKSGLAAFNKRDLDAAMAAFDEAAAMKPREPKSYIDLGAVKQAKGDLDGAIAAYNKAIALDGKSVEAFMGRGYVKKSKGDLAGALADFNRCISLAPGNVEAYVYRGLVKKMKGDVDGAIADYTKAIALNPRVPLTYVVRGGARQDKGNLPGALADYNQAIELNPNIPIAYESRANVEALTRDWPHALADYRHRFEMVEAGQEYSRLYAFVIAARLGDPDGAWKELAAYMDSRKDLQTQPWPATIARYLLGVVSETGLLASASTDSKTAQGEICQAWYFAGMMKLIHGDKAGAAEDLKKCIATGQARYLEYQLAEPELRAF